MTDLFKSDLFRYYGSKKETLKQKLFRPKELKYILLYRKCRNTKNKFLKIYYVYKLRMLQQKAGVQIPYKTEIGKGFYIGHANNIVINPNAKIGNNVNVAQGVTIGQENRGSRMGSPVIGDKVWIGANSVIVGNITIGDDVMIAPLTFVNFDVPNHSIVIGNPAKIIHKDNATEDYINRTV
ncbi:MAG: serine acetyltransferase [Clostridia bacterium]|nr:serine acetyltransferase [Clostridia bacterium]